jgi:hypothetical protein
MQTLRRLCSLLFVVATPVLADPGYYLLTPYSQPGQLALDVRYWTVKFPHSSAVLWPEAGLRYGVNSRWTTEVYASFEGDSLNHQSINSLDWQNEVLLTQGQYPFDLAVHLQAIHSPDDGDALQWGPVFQTELGHTQLNFNLVFEHGYKAGSGPTQLKYQWQALYRLTPGWRAGVQGFGELGPWSDWSHRQSHRAGPTLRMDLGRVELQASYLWGKVFGGKADMFTANLVLEF